MSVDETKQWFKATFPGGTEFKFKGDELVGVYSNVNPSYDKYREVTLEYQETFGNSSKSIKIDTYLLLKEIKSLYMTLFSGDADE